MTRPAGAERPSKIDPRTRNPGAFYVTDRFSLDNRETALLVALVGAHQPRTILEVGTGLGSTTAKLVEVLRPGQRVVTMDPDPGRYAQAVERIDEALWRTAPPRDGDPLVTMFDRRLEDVPLEEFAPFDLVLVDGHPERRLEDLDIVTPHLAEGALLVFHDMGHRSPGRKTIPGIRSRGFDALEVWTPRGIVLAQRAT